MAFGRAEKIKSVFGGERDGERARFGEADIFAGHGHHVVRESSGEMTSKEGFSVVAPMKVMWPASTCGRKASCCALLKRCTSSTKTMVRSPERALRSASAMTSLISLMPVSTALKGVNSERVSRAISRANAG